jgi:hypothetical protein
MLVIADKSSADVGGAAGAHYTYGLSDAFNLMAEGAWSLLALNESGKASTPRTRPSWAANVDVGIGYVLDVLQWVPYGGLLLGGYALSGGTLDATKYLPGAEVALGLDFKFDRSLSAGVAVRQHLLLTDLNTYPSFTQAFARIQYSWGW